MQITILQPVTIDVYYIRVYAEDKNQDIKVDCVIDLKTGKIDSGTFKNETINIYAKIVDCGCYYLLDKDFQVVASRTVDYVPNRIIPGEYGDYINFEIVNGTITNWPNIGYRDLASFFPDENVVYDC